MGKASLKELTRDKNWTADEKESRIEFIKLGCHLRNADSLESIAKSMQMLCNDRDLLERNTRFYKERYNEILFELKTIIRQKAYYKGRYEKLKRELKELKKEQSCSDS